MPVQTTDVFLVNRGGVSYRVTAADIVRLTKDTDLMLVNRNGTSYKLTGANFKASSFRDTDLFLVNRAGLSYRESGANVRSLLVPQVWDWDATTDTYTTVAVANRNIDVQSRMRRCLLNNAGVVQMYLDADNSANRSGDWLRIVETATLNTPYTGTFGTEVQNTLLRAGLPGWSAGVRPRGQRVTRNGSVWECVAASTTATPAAGTVAATLNGTSQVMVEIPRFSVRHRIGSTGEYSGHSFSVALGTVTTDGYEVHPAFIRPDGSHRDFIYVGAYLGTGTGGNGSLSGVNNTVNITRKNARGFVTSRGTGWHVYGYWTHNAIQWLYLTEYADLNSRRALGTGADPGTLANSNTFTNSVNTGSSNDRGNRCGNSYSSPVVDTSYVSYRGLENITGDRAGTFRDGVFVDYSDPAGARIYICPHHEQFADDITTDYVDFGALSVSKPDDRRIRDIGGGISLLPSALGTSLSYNSYLADAFVLVKPATSNLGAMSVLCRNTVPGGTNSGMSIFGTNAAHLDTASVANVGTRICYSP